MECGDVVDSRICANASAIGEGDVSKEVLMDGRATNEGASGRRVAIGRSYVCQRLAWRQQDARLTLR